MKRIYDVTLKASEAEWQRNEDAHPLKKVYDGYLEPRKLYTEAQLIAAIKDGRFIEAKIVGAVDE